jgi:DeoR family glycerol-3-phosphate regulon repressor
MSENTRRTAILTALRNTGRVATEALARQHHVTVQTIRRDLAEMEGASLLTRTHGGAVPRSTVANIGYADRQVLNADAKRQIAKRTASLIPDRASLFLDIGTSAEAVAEALLQHDGLMIITNNLRAAMTLADNPSAEVIVAGGVLRRSDAGLVGEQTVAFLRQFKPDFAVLSASALDTEGDFLDFDFREVQVSRTARTQARRSILVADASKFQRQAPVRIGSLADIDTFITDAPPPAPLSERLSQWQTDLHIAGD